MDLKARNTGLRRPFFLITAVLSLALIMVVTGCPTFNSPGNGTTEPGTGQPIDTGDDVITAKIITPASTIGISALEEPVSVLYTVTGNPDLNNLDNFIIGFRIKVADSSPNSGAISDPVVIKEDLPAGERQAFNFDPADAGVGSFRVGIIVSVDGIEIRVESTAVIVVQGSPDPQFILPDKAVKKVKVGDEVSIIFDVGDPEGVVQWRLFYLTENDTENDFPDDPADQLGVLLDVGSGNAGNLTFLTDDFESGALGKYQLGISATDSGFSIAATVARDMTNRIVTIPTATTPGPIIHVVEEDVP